MENGYYHIYNRGVEKRQIFYDENDCKVFLHYMKMYLLPEEELQLLNNVNFQTQRFVPLNLSKEVDLLAFALMPNHIHLLIKQHTRDGIVKFMRRVSTAYVMYFNKKYQRVGVLFQGRYKASLIDNEIYLLHLTRYIHLNPNGLSVPIDFNEFSSYPYYLRKKQASWIKPKEILSYFSTVQKTALKDVLSYKSFVEDYPEDPKEFLKDLTLETE